MDKFKNYHDAVNFLESLSNLPLKGDYMLDTKHAGIYIKRMRCFLELLGNPDVGLKFIHITGTSGKGTVTNMIHEILIASGSKVGSFTSPFVTTTIEKIKVDKKYISPVEFAEIAQYLKPFVDKAYMECPYGRPSYFEMIIAIAFIYFKRQKCDFVILEVGCGGRNDATNVIKDPLVTAITNIDYDHTEILGRTLKEIAWEKVGIIKRGSTFFTIENRKRLLSMFDRVCTQNSVHMHVLPKQKDYQENNIRLSTAIAKYLGINEKYIERGIQNARLACRFEIMQKLPMVVLDGAHNRAKIKTTVDNIRKLKFRKLHLVLAMSDSKDHISILKQLIPLADRVVFTRFQNKHRKCAHPKEILRRSRPYFKAGTMSKIYLDPETAFSEVLKEAKPHDLVLATGSFYFAGDLRKRWYPEETVLKKRNNF